MKKLHEVLKFNPFKRTHPYFDYIQVKDGLVSVTSGHALLRYTVDAIFGEGIFDENETYYVPKGLWVSTKAYQAGSFVRRDDQLEVFDKKGTLTGVIKLEQGVDYPDLDSVAPKELGSYLISLNSELLTSIANATGNPVFSLYKSGSVINLSLLNEDAEPAACLIMPVVDVDAVQQPDGDDVEALKGRIAELENQLNEILIG